MNKTRMTTAAVAAATTIFLSGCGANEASCTDVQAYQRAFANVQARDTDTREEILDDLQEIADFKAVALPPASAPIVQEGDDDFDIDVKKVKKKAVVKPKPIVKPVTKKVVVKKTATKRTVKAKR